MDSAIISYVNSEITGLNNENNFESAYIDLFPILAKIDSGGINALDANDSIAIEDLSALCEYEYGTAVYIARGIYARLFHEPYDAENECDGFEERSADSELKNENGSAINFHLDGNLLIFDSAVPAGSAISVYDINGKLIYDGKITNLNKITLPEINNGIYFLQVMPTGQSGKFLLVK
jgi:hypothetical protein